MYFWYQSNGPGSCRYRLSQYAGSPYACAAAGEPKVISLTLSPISHSLEILSRSQALSPFGGIVELPVAKASVISFLLLRSFGGVVWTFWTGESSSWAERIWPGANGPLNNLDQHGLYFGALGSRILLFSFPVFCFINQKRQTKTNAAASNSPRDEQLAGRVGLVKSVGGETSSLSENIMDLNTKSRTNLTQQFKLIEKSLTLYLNL